MRFIITIWFILCGTISHSQLTKTSLLGEFDEVVIPFTYVNGFILVDVIFQRILPLKFIVDTGAENSILLKKDYAEMLRTPYHRKIKLYGSDLSGKVVAYVSNGIFLQFTNTKSVRHNILVLEEDFVHLDQYIGTQVDGILGAELFRGLIMKIDFKNSELILIDPLKFNKSRVKHYQALDLEIVSSKPYLNCMTEVKDGLKVKTKLLIDTGAALTALFHHNTDSLLNISDLIVKGSLGKGLGGDIEGFSGRIHRLQIGEYYFNNLLSSFQEIDSSLNLPNKVVRNGIIGTLLLERFDVYIDFADSKMYLKAKKKYNKDFDYDKSGLTIFAYGNSLNKYYVKYITENSPATDAGIRPGDIILKIGWFSYKWYSLKQINNILSSKNGRKIKMKIKRGDEILIKEFVLRDLFSEKQIRL